MTATAEKAPTKSKSKGESKGEKNPVAKKASANPLGRELIDLRQVTSSYNHRQALSSAFANEGYGVFLAPAGSDKPPVWSLATSDDPAQRQQYVELMETYDKVEDEEKKKGVSSGGIIDLAFNILSNGLLQPIGVRDNGKKGKGGKNTYQLVYGHRRSLAILYLWCKGLTKTGEPRAKFELIKGNHQQLQAASISENLHRKPLTMIEQAVAWQQAMNGGETPEEVANRNGVSTATVENRVSLLELPPEQQKGVEDGRIKYTKAMEIVRNIRNGGDGKLPPTGDAGAGRKTIRSRKEIEKRWAEATDSKERDTLAWVLKTADDGGGVAVLPAAESGEEFGGEVGSADPI